MAAITFVKRSALPVLGKGKEGKPSVTVSDKGQITFSGKATKMLNGTTKAAIATSDGNVYVFLSGSKIAAKVEDADKFDLKMGKKSHTAQFAGSAFLQTNTSYDYKNSGNQTFDVTLDEKNQALVFKLPSGKLEKRPVIARPKRKKVTEGTAASANSTEGVPVNQAGVAEEEIVLQ